MALPRQREGVILRPQFRVKGKLVVVPTLGTPAVSSTMQSGLIVALMNSGLLVFDFQGAVLTAAQGVNLSEEEGRRKIINIVLLLLRAKSKSENLTCSVNGDEIIAFPNAGNFQGFSTKNDLFRLLEAPHTADESLFSKKIPITYPALHLARVTSAFKHLDASFGKMSETIIDELELFGKAIRAYDEQDFASSFSLSWIVVEHEAGKTWESFVAVERAKPHDWFFGERRDLYKPKAMTLSMKMELLSHTREVDFENYRSVFQLRKKRNDWFHSMKKVDQPTARESILRAGKLIEKRLGFRVVPNLG